MNPNLQLISRRQMLRWLSAAPAALVAERCGLATAVAELPHLNETNPAAASLGYTENANSVDARKFPAHAPGQQCANCKYFQGDAQAQYAPCQLYPGNAVNANGWCGGYAAK